MVTLLRADHLEVHNQLTTYYISRVYSMACGKNRTCVGDVGNRTNFEEMKP
jgi:hypothetical protein